MKVINERKILDLSDNEKVNEEMAKKGLYEKSCDFPLASLQFELTSRCNAFCNHCYNNSSPDNCNDAMSADNWINFSKYIVSQGGVFECILSGGEPFLLGEKLFEIMDILHGDGTIMMLITNGYFINSENIKVLKKYKYHWFQISIDGASADYHNQFRNEKGCWEKAIAGARLVSENGIPLKIAHCVTPYNLKDVKKMCDLAYELGAKEIIAGELSLSGRVNAHRDLLLSESQRIELRETVSEVAEYYSGKMRVKSSNSVKKGLVKHMNSPMYGAVIRPNGDVRIDGMAPFVIGNILVDDFADVWKQRIKKCWNDSRVVEYINSFSEDDRNYKYINYVDGDIYLYE